VAPPVVVTGLVWPPDAVVCPPVALHAAIKKLAPRIAMKAPVKFGTFPSMCLVALIASSVHFDN
jgi:hypothetical protein